MIKYILVLISCCFLFACGSKTTVILLPEEDGRAGQVIVKNKSSETTLTEPYTYANVSSDKSSLESKAMEEEEISSSYERLINAEPPKPANFILYFENNTTTLTPESLKLIPQVIEMSRQREPSQIRVIGHTDTKGTGNHNTKLSLYRAKAVAGILKKAGIKLKAMTVTSHGENDLLVQTGDNVSEPRNRRVEIMIR